MATVPEWDFDPKGDGPQIDFIVVSDNAEAACGESYRVGFGEVTRIEATSKTGEFSHIPYVRVWKGDQPFAEFCQHKIIGVYFTQPKAEGR